MADCGAELLNIQLRKWQTEALEAWSVSGCRGIVAAATGTGKTVLAIAAIQRVYESRLRVAIIVPKIALLKQWKSAVRQHLNVRSDRIGLIGGPNADINARHEVVISVINSARQSLPVLTRYWKDNECPTLLIVDECHWAGSEENAAIFKEPFSYTLGLSATPERADSGVDDHIIPGLGEIIFRYPLRDALDDELLSPLRAINLYFDLQSYELDRYRKVATRIDKLREMVVDSLPPNRRDPAVWVQTAMECAKTTPALKRLLNQVRNAQAEQRRLIANAEARRGLLAEIVATGAISGRRVIIFHETIDSAERTLDTLQRQNLNAVIDHSKIPKDRREAALRRFATGGVDILVAVRTVDEGIDVPDADMAIIVSGTLTERQRIQRIGRILRPAGRAAECISLLARGTTEEIDVGRRDETLLGRNRVLHHAVTIESIAELLTKTSSTYQPA